MTPPPNNNSNSSFTTRARLHQLSSQINPPSAESAANMASPFSASVVPQAPKDPLFGLMEAYKADTFEKKVDLGIGAYRDNNAKPWVLPVVQKVRKCHCDLNSPPIPDISTPRVGFRPPKSIHC